MRRLSSAAIVALLALVADGQLAARAQTLLSKQEATARLQKAAEAVNLQTSDIPPFQALDPRVAFLVDLVANVHYELGSQASDGTYELFWSSPDRFREEFRMRNAEETEIATGDKLYILRNTPTMTLPRWSIRKTLSSLKNFYPGPTTKVKRVYSVQMEGKNRDCADFGNDFAQRVICFDPTTGEVTSVRYGAMPPQGPGSITTKELKHVDEADLSDFANIGAKHYPLRIARRDFDEKLEIRIESLTQVAKFLETELAPPTSAMARDWCSSPNANETMQFTPQPILELDPPGRIFAYYASVGIDGRVKKWAPARSGCKYVDDRMGTLLRTAKFPVLSCASKSIEYETMYYAPIAIRLPH